MDTRLTRLEVTVDHIQGDLRDLRSDLRDLRSEVRHFQSEVRTDLRVVRDQSRLDFRLLFGALISVALGMAALMAKGFHWL
jgi:hypothetical protein